MGPGYLAVDFFLVLSGFILSHNYLYKKSIDGLGDQRTPELICRRIARLWPLHIFSLGVFILTIYFLDGKPPSYGENTAFTLIQNITLTHNIGFNPWGLSWNFPSWSISVELWVSIGFIVFIRKETPTSLLMLIAIVGMLILFYHSPAFLDLHTQNYYGWVNAGLLRGISCFSLGIISYRIYRHYRDFEIKSFHFNILEVFMVISIAALLFGRDGKNSPTDYIAPFLFMLAVPLFAFERGSLSKLFTHGQYLGQISYSIYLNHIAILYLVSALVNRTALSGAWLAPLFLGALIVYSHFTYQWIERSGNRKLQAWLRRLTNPTKIDKPDSEETELIIVESKK